jgi:hypothetical protein
MKPTTFVVEAAGGVFRTVTGCLNAGQLHVVLHADNPLCHVLQGDGHVRVMAADGQAFHARSKESGAHAMAPQMHTMLHERLGPRPAKGTPRIFSLSLGTTLGAEKGQTPRT